jgi:hypothetical protein
VSRAEERRKAWLAAAQSEKINQNGMHRNQSPASTRAVAEAAQTMKHEDPEPAPRDHTVAAGCCSVEYRGSVRDRLERVVEQKRDESEVAPTPQSASAKAWNDYNETYRAKYGHYPSN